MKAIVCEMCSSNDVVKQGGYYVCQNCGTKYTTEDARKLMVEVEGKVDVSGSTVSVDTTDATKRSLENARRAMQKEDWEEAERYYNLVEQNEPSNIEAIFYSAYAKAKTTLVIDDVFRREAVFKSFGKSISIIDDNFDVTKEEELRPMVDKMTTDIIALCGSQFVYTVKKDGYGNVTQDNSSATYRMFAEIKSDMLESLKNIGAKLKKTGNKAAVHYYELAKTLLVSSEYKLAHMVDIGEGMMGLDDEAALTILKDAAGRYESNVKGGVSKEDAEAYKEFCGRVFPLMKQLDPSFNQDEEFKKVEETAAAGMKTKKSRGIKRTFLGIIIFLLFILGIALGIVMCSGII